MSQGLFPFSLFFPPLYFLFLQIFKTVTLEFSTDTPCLANVIPAMDRMHDDLLSACNNEDYSAAIRDSLKIGKNLLNKYYSITDNSEVYRIAMSELNMNFMGFFINNIFSSSPNT